MPQSNRAELLYLSGLKTGGGGAGGSNNFQTLTVADMTVNSGFYTTLNAIQSGSSIDIEFGGGNATLDPRNAAFLEFDTGVATLPFVQPGYNWTFALHLAYDISGFVGNEDLNLGTYVFTDTFDSAGATGTGYFGGGLLSDSLGAAKECKNYLSNQKSASSLSASADIVPATSDALNQTCSFRIISGPPVQLKINAGLSTFQFRSTPGGWAANYQNTVSTSANTITGSNYRVGIWMSRATSALPNVTFSITDFSFAAIKQP
jgi:hypothetical protein